MRSRAKRRTVETGLLWDKVPKAMETEDWEDDEDGDTQIRRLYIGTTMSLAPSGKMYMPWATSNLLDCPHCGGTGKEDVKVPLRRLKRAVRRLRALERKAGNIIRSAKGKGESWEGVRRFNHGYANTVREQLTPIVNGYRTCGRCGGYGSHEAWDDERFWEILESETENHGYFISHGDDGQVYIAESRTKPDDDDDDEEEAGE